ncbi:MAG: 4Fe-4S dicluster domain-containing protein [Myxococcales bacterium]
MRLGMLIELDRCVGCLACVSSCKERWDTGPGAARDWVVTFEHQRLGLTFYPGLCMQCSDHPCTTECPTGATYRRNDGIVVVDPDVCIGCGNCISLCPYGARRIDPVKNIVEKCNLCAPYVDRGEAPACVTTCLADVPALWGPRRSYKQGIAACAHLGRASIEDRRSGRWTQRV